jgi:hypothetical protein
VGQRLANGDDTDAQLAGKLDFAGDPIAVTPAPRQNVIPDLQYHFEI